MLRPKQISNRDLQIKEKLVLSVSVGFAISFNFLLFGMLYIFLTNRSFSVVFADVFVAALAVFFYAWIIISGLLFFIPEKVHSVLASVLMGILVAGYMQGNILNSFVNLGSLTGDEINWSAYGGHTAVNTIIWLLLIISPMLVRYFTSTLVWKRTMLITCALLSCMQGAALVTELISNSGRLQSQSERYLSMDGLFEVSSVNNVLVFVVDRLDYDYVEDVRRSDSVFFDRLDGFTEFTNTAASYTGTFPASTYIATGVLYDYIQTMEEYFDYAWRNSEFISTLKKADYSMTYYIAEWYSFSDYSQIEYAADNIRDGRVVPDRASVIDNFLTLTAYRFAPMLLKPIYWMPSVVIETANGITSEDKAAVGNDIIFFDILQRDGLTLQSERRNYSYIHLLGAHPPYTYNEYGRYVGRSDAVAQTKGAFYIIYSYMDKMKELGIYEDSTIVIVGDHGDTTYWNPSSFHIGCFIKPAGSANAQLVQNDAPISFGEHILPSILASEGLEYSFLGVSAFEVGQNFHGIRYATAQTGDTDFTKRYPDRVVFKITGHAGDEDSYEIIG